MIWYPSHRGRLYIYIYYEFPHSSASKESACKAGDLSSIPGSGRSLKKKTATHSSVLALRIPWKKEPSRLQSWVHKSWTQFSDQATCIHLTY